MGYICLTLLNTTRMKKLIYLVCATLLVIIAVSCAKQKSGDLPLPTSRKEAVYITTDNNNLISYNPYTGDKQWEVHFNGACEGVPVMYKKKLYLVTNAGWFYSVDILKGEIYFQKDIKKITKLSIAMDNEKIYVAAIDSLHCFDLSGNKQWSYDPGTGKQPTSSPQVANGHIYLGIGDKLHAVNTSGTQFWTSPSAGGVDIVSSPRVSNSLVYFGGGDKMIYALNESNGSIKWQYLTKDKVFSSPMVYGGMCILGSQDYGVYCIDTTSPSIPMQGELRWKYPTIDRVSSSPTVYAPDNTVLVGSYDFNLYAIDHVSGVLKWKYPAGSIIKSSPVVYGEHVYFTALDRYLYCVDVRNGSTVWKAFLNGSTESSPMVDDLKNGQYPGNSGMSTY